MADTKISDLTAATSVAAADLVPIVQGGATKKATVADLVNAGDAPGILSLPSDYGLLAMNYPPIMCSNTGAAVNAAGTVYVYKIRLPEAASVTNLHIQVSTVGATLTSGQNFMALYDSSKNLIAATADQSTAWTSLGFKTAALTGGPFARPAGIHYVALYYNGTTAPQFLRTTNSAIVNGTLSAANSNIASADTGRTTSMPATLGTFTAYTNALWVGVS